MLCGVDTKYLLRMRNKDRKPLERQIEKSLDYLNKNQFQKSRDMLKEYSSESMIHFLQLNSKEYLVVNHYAYRNSVENQGLDLWLSQYDKVSDIGSKNASAITCIKLGVLFPADADLINKEIERCSDRFLIKG